MKRQVFLKLKPIAMKKILFASLIIPLIIISCSQPEVKSSIEGSWALVSGKYITPDTVINYPLTSNGNHMKIIGKKYFSTIWQDTTVRNPDWLSSGFNGGDYSFENGVYTENLQYFSLLPNIGGKVTFKADLQNDTLQLTSIPTSDADKYSNIEKWRRLK